MQFACLYATLLPSSRTQVPEPGELLLDEDVVQPLRTAALSLLDLASKGAA